MAEDEEQVTESNPGVNTETVRNEPAAMPFRITLELPLFLVMAGMSLSGVAINNILLYRTCIHSLDHSKEECQIFLSLDKNNETALENEVQKYMTSVSTVKSVIDSIIPAVLSFFLGGWSDTHGRKPLIVWPLFGIAFSSILLVVYCLLDNLGPWWFIITVLPYSMGGGFTIFFTGAFCYLTDISTPAKRSLRMTILEASTSVGSIVGSLLSARVLMLVGNTWLIVIATACNALAYAFSNIYLKESLAGAIEGGIKSVFDISLVKAMVHQCFKRRPNNGRAQILLLTIANSLSVFILYGLYPLEYLYTREKFHWTLSDYTLFGAVNTTISFLGAFIGIAILQTVMGISDLVTTNISFISTLGEYTMKALAFKWWYMYLGAGVSLFKGLSPALIRSFLTKILPTTEISKVFALMASIEGLCPLLAPPLYNSLYRFTLTAFPGSIYVLSGGIILCCIIFITTVHYFRRNVTSEYQVLESSIQT